MIVAVSGAGDPVGMITWSLDGRGVFRTSLRGFAGLYGPVGGAIRLGVYRLMGWLIAPRRGAYINTIWVDPAWRPRGAGTLLLKAAGQTILMRAVADIRRDDRRGRLLFGRQGMKPVTGGFWPRAVRLAGFERLERPQQPGYRSR
jgi:ribosomal protein S18 acetylase RimI-like enzyme